MSSLANNSETAVYLEWLDAWHERLSPVSLVEDIIREAGNPGAVGVLLVDLLVGFCSEGPLSSPRVGRLTPGGAELVRTCLKVGIRTIGHAADSHSAHAAEFAAFPPHCTTGSPESERAAEFANLEFQGVVTYLPKNCIAIGQSPHFQPWLDANSEVRHWIVLGDCTDFCVYQAAMHLLTAGYQIDQPRVVWLPANLIDTYDLPTQTARELGAFPHPGDFHHRVFLTHLALNGARVASEITP